VKELDWDKYSTFYDEKKERSHEKWCRENEMKWNAQQFYTLLDTKRDKK